MSLTQPTGSSSGTPGYGANGPPGSGSTAYSSAGSAPSGQSGQEDTASTPDKTGASGSPLTLFGWLLGWAVMIFFLWLLTRSRAGYALVYYGAWAALILLVLTQYRWFVAVLAPVSGLVVQPPATSSGAASSGGGGTGGSF